MTKKDPDIIVIDERGEHVTTTSDERLLAMLIYVTSFFTTIIGPILIWLIKRDDSLFIDYHGKEYLNFIISYAVYGFIAGLTVFIAIGIVLAPLVAILVFIFTIIAAIKAFQGEMYKIPLVFRIIK